MITGGVDEAGRGPVVGPLVLACAVFDEKGVAELKKLNVRDSKKVSPSRRELLEPEIKKIALDWKLTKIIPYEIDKLRKKISLNVIEAYRVSQLFLSLKVIPPKTYVDAVDTDPEVYKKNIIQCLTDKNFKFPRKFEIISEHKADANYIEVGAASIIAKVERDREIEKIKEKYGDFGSGYPSDPLTQEFIHKLIRKGELPHFVRRSWDTVNRKKQTSLDEFLP